jgi:hypothetical protein
MCTMAGIKATTLMMEAVMTKTVGVEVPVEVTATMKSLAKERTMNLGAIILTNAGMRKTAWKLTTNQRKRKLAVEATKVARMRTRRP